MEGPVTAKVEAVRQNYGTPDAAIVTAISAAILTAMRSAVGTPQMRLLLQSMAGGEATVGRFLVSPLLQSIASLPLQQGEARPSLPKWSASVPL